jgi:hypothetical protein
MLILLSGCEQTRKPQTEQAETALSQKSLQVLQGGLKKDSNDPNIACIVALSIKRGKDALKYANAGPVEINDSLLGLERTQVLEILGLPVMFGCNVRQTGEIVEFMYYCNKKTVGLPCDQINVKRKVEPLILLDEQVVAYGWDAVDKYTLGYPSDEKTKILSLIMAWLGCK